MKKFICTLAVVTLGTLAAPSADASPAVATPPGVAPLIPSSNAQRFDAYLPGTSFTLSSTLLKQAGQIKLRSFRDYHFYDGEPLVDQQIIDDGSAHTQFHYDGVNERHLWLYWRDEIGQLTDEHHSAYDVEEQRHKLVRSIHFERDESGNVVSEQVKDANRSIRYVIRTGYDSDGRVISRQNAAGETTHYSYSGDTVHVSVDGNSSTADRVLSDTGQVVTETFNFEDLESISYHYTYDADERLSVVTYPDDGQTTIEYTESGSLARRAFPDGTDEVYTYDNVGRIASLKQRDNVTQAFTYDSFGRTITETFTSPEDEILEKIDRTYRGYRVATVAFLDGSQGFFGYDYAGRLLGESTRDGITNYDYDALSRPVRILHRELGASIEVTFLTYDLLDRVITERVVDSQEDELSNRTFTYVPELERAQEAWVYKEAPVPEGSGEGTELAQVAPENQWMFDAIFFGVNAYRIEQGDPELVLHPFLSHLAQQHSDLMASGEIPAGHDGIEIRAQEARDHFNGTSNFGENVAMNGGLGSGPDAAINGWIDSPSHQQQMVGSFAFTGIGVARNDAGENYFVQIFASPLNE
jgi:YD repeat-containing protein